MAERAPKTYDSFKKEALVAMFFGLRMPEDRQNFYIDFQLLGFSFVKLSNCHFIFRTAIEKVIN